MENNALPNELINKKIINAHLSCCDKYVILPCCSNVNLIPLPCNQETCEYQLVIDDCEYCVKILLRVHLSYEYYIIAIKKAVSASMKRLGIAAVHHFRRNTEVNDVLKYFSNQQGIGTRHDSAGSLLKQSSCGIQ